MVGSVEQVGRIERIRRIASARAASGVSGATVGAAPKLLGYMPKDGAESVQETPGSDERPQGRRHSPYGGTRPMSRNDQGSAFSAHLLAGAPRRGLKGGQEMLDTARSTYLGTEWSGSYDRRQQAGSLTRSKI